MLAWVVIYRLHHRQAARPHTTHAVAEGHRRTFHSLTPFLYLFTSLLPYFLFARHVTKNLSPQLLWNLHLQNGDARNSFRIRSYQKCRVSLALSFLFSLLAPRVFHISFPIMRFRTLSKKHPGGGSLSPQVWTFRRWDLHTLRGIVAIRCRFAASYRTLLRSSPCVIPLPVSYSR